MQIAASTLQLLAAGTAALGAAGSLASGYSQAAAYKQDAKIAEENAVIAEQQAAARQDMIRREAKKLRGAQRASVGAAGITLDGSAFDVMEDSAVEAELDALTAGYEGKLQARAYATEAAAKRYAAKGSIFEGVTGAGAQALSGYGAWLRMDEH